jgi:DNA-binding SARP family transcriptional activator
MISLKRAGRQAEALSAYRACARFLDEQYGLRPGAELQRVRDSVLPHGRPLTVSTAPS